MKSAYVALGLAVLATGLAAAGQEGIPRRAHVDDILGKPKLSRLTAAQKSKLIGRDLGVTGSISGAPVVLLSPRTMIVSNRASMLFNACGLYWPAADAAYFEKKEGVSPSIQFRIFVDGPVKHVIVSAGMRTDLSKARTWELTFRKGTGGTAQKTTVQSSGDRALASAVFKPAGQSWYEGTLTPGSDGAFCLDFLEFTLVR